MHGVVHPSARFMERSWLGDVTPSPDSSGLKKWQTKACKVMFAIKIMIKKELLEYKRDKKTGKEAMRHVYNSVHKEKWIKVAAPWKWSILNHWKRVDYKWIL